MAARQLTLDSEINVNRQHVVINIIIIIIIDFIIDIIILKQTIFNRKCTDAKIQISSIKKMFTEI